MGAQPAAPAGRPRREGAQQHQPAVPGPHLLRPPAQQESAPFRSHAPQGRLHSVLLHAHLGLPGRPALRPVADDGRPHGHEELHLLHVPVLRLLPWRTRRDQRPPPLLRRAVRGGRGRHRSHPRRHRLRLRRLWRDQARCRSLRLQLQGLQPGCRLLLDVHAGVRRRGPLPEGAAHRPHGRHRRRRHPAAGHLLHLLAPGLPDRGRHAAADDPEAQRAAGHPHSVGRRQLPGLGAGRRRHSTGHDRTDLGRDRRGAARRKYREPLHPLGRCRPAADVAPLGHRAEPLQARDRLRRALAGRSGRPQLPGADHHRSRPVRRHHDPDPVCVPGYPGLALLETGPNTRPAGHGSRLCRRHHRRHAGQPVRQPPAGRCRHRQLLDPGRPVGPLLAAPEERHP